jgi:hypothetical protein
MEKDPLKRFELKLWMEIKGDFLGGMAAAMSWVKYKTYYYDKLPSEDAKKQINSVLLSMLKSNKYTISDKAKIAYVCADIGLRNAIEDINLLIHSAKDPRDIR